MIDTITDFDVVHDDFGDYAMVGDTEIPGTFKNDYFPVYTPGISADISSMETVFICKSTLTTGIANGTPLTVTSPSYGISAVAYIAQYLKENDPAGAGPGFTTIILKKS